MKDSKFYRGRYKRVQNFSKSQRASLYSEARNISKSLYRERGRAQNFSKSSGRTHSPLTHSLTDVFDPCTPRRRGMAGLPPKRCDCISREILSLAAVDYRKIIKAFHHYNNMCASQNDDFGIINSSFTKLLSLH